MPKRVAVVGGGVGGSFVANKLAYKTFDKLRRGELEILVIEPTDRLVYQPGFLYVPFRVLGPDVMFRNPRKVYHPSVRHISKSADKIDIKERKVVLENGEVIPYDYLVVATGLEVKTDHFPGFKTRWHTLWTYEGAKAFREALQKFGGGTFVFSVASTPFKCPVAPYEFLFMFDDWLMARGLKGKTKIIYTMVAPHLHAQPNVNKFLTKEFEMRGIEYHTKFEVTEVGEGHISGTSQIKADLIHIVPKHVPPAVIMKSELYSTKGVGGVPVDRHTLEIEGGSGVEYALGDVTNLAVPKAGAVAHFQAEVVAARIYEDMAYGHADTQYNGRVICFVLTGLEEATQISWNYDMPALYPPTPSRYFVMVKELTNQSMWSALRCGL
ncbi:MAG: FAD/NAD(P)-binding oxidoreductase [Pyrobaculum sp.]